jgi:hypothetical protein
MAFIPPEQQNQNAPQGVTTPNPQATAGGMPPPTSGGSSGAGATGAKVGGTSQGTSTQFGSSASKLGDYLSANAPQIQGQANTLSGNLNNQYQQLGTEIGQGAAGFGQAVNAGYTAQNPGLVDQAAANPTGFAATSGNVDAFKAQANDQYKGPTAYEQTTPYANVQNDVNTAVQNAGLLGTQGGLANYFGKQGANPTQASNTLDALLLQGNPQAQAQVQGAAGQFQNLPGQFAQSVTGANAQVAPAQAAAQQASQYANSQLGNTATGFQSGLNSTLAGNEANRLAYNKAVTGNQGTAQGYQQQLLDAQQQALAKATEGTGNLGNATTDAAEKARIEGLINPGATSQLNALAPYLSGQPITNAGTLANTATAGQYGEDSALSQLLGGGYTPALNQANLTQAGTAQTVPGMPGSVVNPAGEIQYMGDLASLYGNGQANYWNAGGANNPNLTPVQQAQQVMQQATPGSGLNLDPANLAALQRIVANQYQGVGPASGGDITNPQLSGGTTTNSGGGRATR